MRIHLKAPLHPTENRGKVERAVKNIFPSLELEREENQGLWLVGEGGGREDLEELYTLLRKEKILDAARRVMLSSSEEDTTSFYLNKQAAYMGRLNFSPESPLGPIEVTLEGEVRDIIDWLAPRTFEGKEL